MYPESSPIDGIDTLLVTVDDGTTFRVSPVHFGGPHAGYPKDEALRWMVQRLSPRPHGDERPDSFIGPPIAPGRSPDAVRVLINDWWATYG